ncbi:Protein kinase domain-containing protein [Ruminococcaceae bacterium YRB3002]|nr:Protein kinase domain-containing protein [Ruminococcaceae bacterium YRB3002]
MSDLGIYKELYHYDDKHSLVMNEITHDVCFMKTLSHYDIAVYQYIKDHPNKFIPRIYDIIEQGDTLYVVEEYVQGSSFDSVIHSKKLTDQAKITYFVRLCYGIKFLHDAPQRIIHRDIKLSNIIIAEDGDLKIIDYDAAKIYKPGSKRDTVLIGTEGMAAPEQYGFRQSDERTDIYAIGLLMKEAFPNNPRMQKIAAKASAFEPNDRYQNISALIMAIEPEKHGDLLFNPIWPPPGFRTRKWYKMLIAILFWALVIFWAWRANPWAPGNPFMTVVLNVFWFSSALACTDLCFDWTGIYRILPGMKVTNGWRFLIRGVYSILLIFGIYVLCTIVMTIRDTYLNGF